ncbi:hypothetical protein [Agrobacterium burrii]|uniref:Uncharacterized protein n=1 Tax=Agrobacterium burrii TaxID=2815339 RepID=A0ABS3ERI0_9HYPH|nr:hypothetical protein [Agrobacterium burrii]MBO0134614.1 hypothetical protein [Agrobacterium burrii]
MTDIVERLRFIAIDNAETLTEDEHDTLSEAAAILTEAEKREKEARAKALEEAAAYHDDLAAQHATSHEHVVSDHHEMMERQHTRFAAAIRALQSEER